MGDNSNIEWTGATWNMLVAFVLDMLNGTYTFDDAPGMKWRRGWFCVHASEGCRNCYAEKMNLWRGNGLAYVAQNLPLVRFEFVGLDQPLRWTRPRAIFPCSMTDLFADFYTDEQIDRVFNVMALTPRHVYQVLTKRAKRMREYVGALRGRWGRDFVDRATHDGAQVLINAFEQGFPNVWLGVSVEHQKAAEERVPQLLKTPAAVRWLSVEPLLGPVDLCAVGMKINGKLNVETGEREFLDWVVLGGESGSGARPMHPRWARQVRDDCVTCGVPFFFKQWGAYRPLGSVTDEGDMDIDAAAAADESKTIALSIDGRVCWKGDDDPIPAGALSSDCWFVMSRVGKKLAGRVLDGRTWDEMPKVVNK
jgi:protein gp37